MDSWGDIAIWAVRLLNKIFLVLSLILVFVVQMEPIEPKVLGMALIVASGPIFISSILNQDWKNGSHEMVPEIFFGELAAWSGVLIDMLSWFFIAPLIIFALNMLFYPLLFPTFFEDHGSH